MAITARLCVLAATIGAAHSAETMENLLKQLTELEQEMNHNHELLDGLSPGRRLATATPSIYGVSTSRNTRAYTHDENISGAMTCMWLIICGSLVMFMQAGFAMLEAGLCRRKFVQNILLKNLTDVCIGTWGWWCFGWSFAFTGPMETTNNGFSVKKNGFMGHESFMGHHFVKDVGVDGNLEPTDQPLKWFFQWTFASAAATIVSGGVAERVKFPGYVIYSFLITSFIYPTIVAWTWGAGWLSADKFNRVGYVDFAGSGIVHLTGGVGALVGAIVSGPRNGRFREPRMKMEKPYDENEKDPFAPHSMPLVILGTFILWFGWYGFNCGSTGNMIGIEQGFIAAQVAMNTTISASVGGLIAFLLKFAIIRRYDVGAFCGGILGGLVSITAGCSNVECGSALAIGICGGIIYVMNSVLLQLIKVDDPIDAWAVHGACGIWGVIAAALFDMGRKFESVHGWKAFRCTPEPGLVQTNPCFPKDDDMGKSIVGANFMEVAMIMLWSGGLSAIIFVVLKVCKILVASPEEQDQGFDEAKHSPSKAYELSRANPQAGPSTNTGSASNQPI